MRWQRTSLRIIITWRARITPTRTWILMFMNFSDEKFSLGNLFFLFLYMYYFLHHRNNVGTTTSNPQDHCHILSRDHKASDLFLESNILDLFVLSKRAILNTCESFMTRFILWIVFTLGARITGYLILKSPSVCHSFFHSFVPLKSSTVLYNSVRQVPACRNAILQNG